MPIGALVAVPELQNEGVARLEAERGREVAIRFLATGAEMTQEERRTVRYCLLPGTRVRVRVAGAAGVPSAPAAPGTEAAQIEATVAVKPPTRDAASGLLVYALTLAGGGEAVVREDAVTQVHPPRDPVERLATVAFHDLRPSFANAGSAQAPEPWGALMVGAREELGAWRDAAWATTGGVAGLAGARVRPLPHQVIAARRVLSDRQVRFLLADEVGLGKTIEAGLIMQSLLAMRPNLRVLVVAPGALLSQWFLELYLKFGGRRFLMLDQERLRAHSGNPFTDEQFVLASCRALEELDPRSALRLAQSKWDVLVVDECHRMQPGGVLYKRISILSKTSPHVLLLSATPARSHADAHLALLALLQPQSYRTDDLAAFQARQAAHDQLVTLMERTAAIGDSGGDAKALAGEWRALLGADPRVAELADQLAVGTAGVGEALLAHAREHHRLDRRMIRHRRAALAKLAAASGVRGLETTSRSVERVGYKPDASELAVRAALTAYRGAVLAAHRTKDGVIPPRLAHWLLQLEIALATHPLVLERLLAMRATVLTDPEEYAEYRDRAVHGETLTQVLRGDLSDSELTLHVAISASCNAEPKPEDKPLAALREAVTAWAKKPSSRTAALIRRLKQFWKENPAEKCLVFTSHGLAVAELAEALGDSFGEKSVETFGAHQDALGRETAVRRFREEDECPLLVCDPLGGEGRNFQFVSVVAHHDLPWSVAAVEQRIGRVDRLGRDGEVPSWVLCADHDEAVDLAWTDVLDRAVGVFTASSSGLEFVADRLETGALGAVLAGGAPALRTALPELTALVAGERDLREARADELFHEEAAVYANAARLATAVDGQTVPVDAVCRWIRGMGGLVRRDDEPPHAFHLRTRHLDQAEDGVFTRAAALVREDLAFFAMGNGVVDRVLADADAADWCAAAAWRRAPVPTLAKWEGLRAAFRLSLDLAPLAAAGLPLDCLRRLLVVAAPARQVVFVRLDDALIETGTAPLAVLTPAFDPRKGDRALSLRASREFWSLPVLGGRFDQVARWQDRVRVSAKTAQAEGDRLLAGIRDPLLAEVDRLFAAGVAAAEAQAATAIARLGDQHPDAIRAEVEADEERSQTTALRAALARAKLELTSVSYVVVA